MLRSAVCATALAIIMSMLPACSMLSGTPNPSFKGESGNVNSIEMAWGDGHGMGAFVGSTSAPQAGGAPLKYRIRVVFDTGFATPVVQDGSVSLAVGDRVWIEDGRVVPHVSEQTDPKRNLAHF